MASIGSDMSVSEMFDVAEGKGITKLIVQGFGAWIVAVFGAVAAGLQQALNFLFLPFTAGMDIAKAAIDAFILQPFSITAPAWAQTATEVQSFEIIAGPVGTALALSGIVIVILYLSAPITSNWLPGLMVDIPIWGWFTSTPEEEEQGET